MPTARPRANVPPMRTALIALIALSALACKPPPEAPAELDELAGYIYGHHPDEDPAAMQAGLQSLTDWLDANWAEAEEGYVISALSEETVDAVDEVDRSSEEMIGLAVPTASVYSVDQAVYAMVGVMCDEVYPDMFWEYERDTFGDADCFLARECDRLEAREFMESHFPLDVVSIAQSYNQYLWVELEGGWAMVQRNWLEMPPEVSGPLASYIEVDEQFYLNLFLPADEGFWRLQATWMIFSQDGVPEDAAMNLAVNNMVDNSETLDEYLSTL
jgi:hypothetical protein